MHGVVTTCHTNLGMAWPMVTFQFYSFPSDKPENLSLRLGSSPQVELTVMENDTIPFTCQADGRPTARMTLSREGGSVVSSGLSPLSHSLRSAQCSDTGTYLCSADNVIGQDPGTASVKLYVRCKSVVCVCVCVGRTEEGGRRNKKVV